MADPAVPLFRGESGSDCEEFIRSIYAHAFEKDKADDDKWIATYAATRLSGKALRWFARLDPSVKKDWTALQVALLDQYPLSDDEDAAEPKAHVSLPNVPTPAAAAPLSAVVANNIASASDPLSSRKVKITECKKARIRVEDNAGTAKGWISAQLGPFTDDLTRNPDKALHVKAGKIESSDTTLQILNVDGWSQLGIKWSSLLLYSRRIVQSGQVEPLDESGTNIFGNSFTGKCSPRVWTVSDAGAITCAWPGSGGSRVMLKYGNQLVVYPPHALPSVQGFPSAADVQVKLFYEPIE